MKDEEQAVRPRRADARRNETTLLEAAAAAFVASGVEAPVRDIAARAGVGTATIYRHFPTRADLVIAVYRHQVEACAAAGPALLAESPSPYEALRRWIAIVPQRTEILAGTLAENVALFDPDLIEPAQRAIAELGLQSWVADLPDGAVLQPDPVARRF